MEPHLEAPEPGTWGPKPLWPELEGGYSRFLSVNLNGLHSSGSDGGGEKEPLAGAMSSLLLL